MAVLAAWEMAVVGVSGLAFERLGIRLSGRRRTRACLHPNRQLRLPVRLRESTFGLGRNTVPHA